MTTSPMSTTDIKETAPEKYTRELSTNPQWQEAPKSGQTFAIVGARPAKE
jgi:hypothetical protein